MAGPGGLENSGIGGRFPGSGSGMDVFEGLHNFLGLCTDVYESFVDVVTFMTTPFADSLNAWGAPDWVGDLLPNILLDYCPFQFVLGAGVGWILALRILGFIRRSFIS